MEEEVERQSQHPSWKLIGNVTSYGVKMEREGVDEADGGVVGFRLAGSQKTQR